MPPRIDPYANKTHKRIDIIILVVITLVLMAFAFRASAQHRQNSAEATGAVQIQTNH